MVAQPRVKEPGDWLHKYVEDELQKFYKGDHSVGYRDLIRTRAVGLWNHLSYDQYCQGGNEDGEVCRNNFVQENR